MFKVGLGIARGGAVTLAVVMALALLVPQAGGARAQSGCGGFQGFNFGSFQGGGFQGGFNFGAFQGGFNLPGGFNFNGGLSGFGFNFGGRPGCGTGVFGLSPDRTTVAPGGTVTYQLVWVSPTQWRDLEFLDLRIRGTRTFLLRWFESSNQFAVVDPQTGQVLDSGAGGSPKVLSAGGIEVLLPGTFQEDSGPTGQAVGLNVQLRIGNIGDEGTQLPVEVAAKSDGTGAEPYELAGSLTIAGSGPRHDPNDDDDDDRKPKTEEQRHQAAQTNRSGLDDFRTEGNAVSSDCAAAWPSVTIANRDGNVVLRLLHEAKDSCHVVQPGDYVEAIGEKQHEQLYDAHQLTVRRNGSRVR